MLVEINNVHINYESTGILKPSAITLVFLHGFTGSSKDWQEVVDKLPNDIQKISIDIVGHGKSDSPGDIFPYTWNSIVSQINSIIDHLKLDKVILIGYSMGGRAALSYIKEYPQKIKGLVLESTIPGISDSDERKKRKENDEKLSLLINKEGIKNFVEYWMDLPLFTTQQSLAKERLEKIKSEKLNNNKIGLSNSLRGFGQGVMPHLWEDIQNISCKVLLISGELDVKYTQLNSLMKSRMIHAEHRMVLEAGHNIHLERPEVFVTLLKDFIKNLQ